MTADDTCAVPEHLYYVFNKWPVLRPGLKEFLSGLVEMVEFDESSPNAYLSEFREAFDSIDESGKLTNLFSDDVPAADRGRIWGDMCAAGEDLVDRFAWAVPTARVIAAIKEHEPIVEIGSGSNAYWGEVMSEAGIDVRCYDVAGDAGGKINKKKRKINDDDATNGLKRDGGPEVLQQEENSERNLFLCFPDEDEGGLGLACLEKFGGEFVLHVGELFGDGKEVGMAPFGRSSSPEFQSTLARDYHCLLKMKLPVWPHEGQTFSIWKRTATCSLVFGEGEDGEGEGEDDSNEEVSMKSESAK